MKSILFHRQYDQYSGGQQKVLDYFAHCLAHPLLDPYISWGRKSVPVETTPWIKHSDRIQTEFSPENHDLIFLAGMDWQDYLGTDGKDGTVINLIQHVRHADPDANVFPFLSEKAARICVSEEVKAAIDATGRVNGPTFAIPNGIDQDYIKSFSGITEPDSVYILGHKQPELAVKLGAKISDSLKVVLDTDHIPREQVLEALGTSEISVLLPHHTEGFFLPALEAMSLSRLVIVPDCVGNRSFCKAGFNCLMPRLELGELLNAVSEARELIRSGTVKEFQANAHRTLSSHTLQQEGQAFYKVLADLGII